MSVPPRECTEKKCRAWGIIHPRIEREDHSGSALVMAKEAMERGQNVKRERPIGSTGILILEEVGDCRILTNLKKGG